MKVSISMHIAFAAFIRVKNDWNANNYNKMKYNY